MSTIVRYTPEEAILIGRAGIIAGVLSIISAVSPAIYIAENGADASNLFSFIVSFFGFLPFAVVSGLKWGKHVRGDKLDTPLARLFILTVCAFAVSGLLFVLLLLTGAWLLGGIIIGVAISVAWWQWPRLPREPVAI